MLLYYFPDLAHPPSAADLDAMALAHAFTGGGVTPVQVQRGPDGGHGLVVCRAPGDAASYVGFHPDHQTWTEASRNGRPWWLGQDDRSPLVPADLAKPDPVPGNPVRLMDGNTWSVPIMRFLPRSLSRGPDGGWQRRILAAHEWLEPLVREYVNAMVAAYDGRPDGPLEVDIPDAWIDGAIRCLAINYRLSAAEVEGTNMMSDANVLDILYATADLDALAKKNEVSLAAPT